MEKTMMLSVLLCALVLHFTTAADNQVIRGGCPYGWSFRTGGCYRVIAKDTPKWEDAQAECRKIGAKLVKITSEEENEFVAETAKKFAIDLKKLWIGMERDCDDDKMYWEDGTNVEYSNWLEGQPDNFDGKENCGHMYLTGEREGTWNDRPCDSPNESIGFMCQKECSAGWAYYSGKCYRIENENKGWRDAVQKCADQGAELVEVKNKNVNAFLASVGAKYAEGKYRMWIAMNRDCEGELRWLDGTTPRYTNWREGMPDDYNDEENCVHMYLTGEYTGKWNDNKCVLPDPSEAAFACQKDDKRLPRFRKSKE